VRCAEPRRRDEPPHFFGFPDEVQTCASAVPAKEITTISKGGRQFNAVTSMF
jgi:hypothetical protein